MMGRSDPGGKSVLVTLLRRYLRPYKAALVAVVVLQFFGTLAALYLPTLNADIIDNGVAKADTQYILRVGAVMLAITLVQVFCSIGAVFFGARTAMGFGRDTRAAVFHHVGSFSAREVTHFGAPSLITRTTNDVQQVQMLVLLTLTLMVSAPIMGVGGIVMALRQDIGLAWLIVVSVVVLVTAIAIIVSRMVPQFRRMQVRLDTVNRVLREQITGIRVVRAFVREPVERERFAAANADLTDTALRVGQLMAFMFPVVMLVLNASSVAVIWFGGQRIDAGQMQVGSLTAFLSYLVQILMSIMMATFMLVMVPRAAVSAERLTEVLDTESSVVTAAELVTSLPEHGEVELRGVSFHYPGADDPVLRDISFRAVAGRTTAIIGSTGSGKTTLLSLVPRLFDATGGSGWCRRRRTSSAAPSRATCATAAPTRPTRSSGRRCASRRPTTSSPSCPRGSRHRSPRAARTSPAGSASGWPSRGRSCDALRSTCSTTRSPRWTSPPTRGSGRRCARPRASRPCSSWRSACRASSTPTRSSSSTAASSSARARTASCS
jgi:ATP-binding cassette subfamily B multidrug efflux pump